MDMRNELQSQNLVTQLTDKLEGGLWLSDSTYLDMLLPTGHEQGGSQVCVDGHVVGFDPRKSHCLVPWAQHVWAIAGYTPRGVLEILAQTLEDLKGLGFEFPNRNALKLVAAPKDCLTDGPTSNAIANVQDPCEADNLQGSIILFVSSHLVSR